MTSTQAPRDSFWVDGLAVRTSNDDPSPIGAVWGRVMGEGLSAQVPQRLDDTLVALYFEYEGDHTAPYTFLLGWRVPEDAATPEGMRRVKVPAGAYATFVAEGAMPAAIMQTWGAIWSAPITRAFIADYEIHDPSTPERVAIHVGVRDA